MKGEKMTRDEAKEILQAVKFLLPTEAYTDRAEEALDMVIEALERKHGKWIVLYDEDSPQDGIWKCSMCDYIRLVDDITPINYCPNCGADMRGTLDD